MMRYPLVLGFAIALLVPSTFTGTFGQANSDIGQEVRIEPLDGTVIQGVLEAFDDSTVTVTTAYGKVTINRTKINRITFLRGKPDDQPNPPTIAPQLDVRTSDGSPGYVVSVSLGWSSLPWLDIGGVTDALQLQRDVWDQPPQFEASMRANETNSPRMEISVALLRELETKRIRSTSLGVYGHYITSKSGGGVVHVFDQESDELVYESSLESSDHLLGFGLLFRRSPCHRPGPVVVARLGLVDWQVEVTSSSTFSLSGVDTSTATVTATGDAWLANAGLSVGYQVNASELGELTFLIGGGYIRHLDSDFDDWYFAAEINATIPIVKRSSETQSDGSSAGETRARRSCM